MVMEYGWRFKVVVLFMVVLLLLFGLFVVDVRLLWRMLEVV